MFHTSASIRYINSLSSEKEVKALCRLRLFTKVADIKSAVQNLSLHCKLIEIVLTQFEYHLKTFKKVIKPTTTGVRSRHRTTGGGITLKFDFLQLVTSAEESASAYGRPISVIR